MKKYIIPASFLLLLTGCGNGEGFKAQKEKFCLNDKNKSITEIKTVEKQAVTERIHLTGSIEPNADKVVHFVSLVDGIISNTYFSLGTAVVKGQVLAEMQSTELSSLKAELRSLKAQIEIAKVDLNAKEQMFKDGISSNRDLIEARNNLHVLESEKQKIESNLNLYSASSTKNVFQLKAPASGIITAKNINSGSTVTNDGEPLFSISNLNNVWAMANIYSTDIAHISKGMEVEIKTLSYPDEIFKGKIDVISQVLDENAKVLKARIILNNESFKLKPGMIADIIALKKTDKQKLAVPTSSLVFFNGKNYILVYKNDCDIEAREVTLLAKNNGITYIESGLHENEKIITQNQLLIFEEIITN
ncbi:efflux RND transporter periplasmic adaptor subunit [Haoranjiania flava]|uniref:Efflux RND transporter periplasmic adaptor subunit n=1 Tax=Haoranjiania flava TaxID=1856322 RepID=A0AAE3LN78_9BACT|nr:efflux RND transporter periplasmic adaptor subunit [Haoranjiania flava]MCU7694676.1 efflux RND transporter periplasmic adaptor subunit [Haoranjiania flava]